jgi:hypothetical protein
LLPYLRLKNPRDRDRDREILQLGSFTVPWLLLVEEDFCDFLLLCWKLFFFPPWMLL